MLRSLKQLYGNQLGASDGDIGLVQDFYFDDHNWAIRYLVVDTGSWLPGRQVLLAPHALGRLDQSEKILRVNLTRKQIQDCPVIESRQPVSRQYEAEYYRYYGWPYYWQGAGLWGMSGFPVLELPVKPLPSESAAVFGPQLERPESHLRSTQAMNGYHLRAGEEIIGHVCDYMMDAQSWAIGQLVIRTGHRLTGKEVLVEVKNINRISYEESTVFASLTKDGIEQSPARLLTPVGN